MSAIIIINRFDDLYSDYEKYLIDITCPVFVFSTVKLYFIKFNWKLILVNHIDEHEIIKFIQKTLDKLNNISMVAVSEYDMDLCDNIRKFLGKRSNLPAFTYVFRNKIASKEYISKASLSTPYVFSSKIDLIAFSNKVIVKPICSAGAIGCRVYPNGKEAFVNNSNIFSTYSIYECEEFIEGSIWHIDGYYDGHNVIFAVATKYIGSCYDHIVNRTILGGISIHSMNKSAQKYSQDILNALKINIPTVFHLECFNLETQPKFLEIACRPGGGPILSYLEKITGIDLMKIAVRAQAKASLNTIFNDLLSSLKYGGYIIIPHGYEQKEQKIFDKVIHCIRNTNDSLFHVSGSIFSNKINIDTKTTFNNDLVTFIFSDHSFNIVHDNIKLCYNSFNISSISLS